MQFLPPGWAKWLWRAVFGVGACGLAAFGGLLYWAGWRTIPQRGGTLTLPVSGPAEIRRDSRGVPRITAKSWEDALFLQGYATAQDRMWQMEGLRRKAAGELSEVIGPATLQLDVESRQMRMRRAAEYHAQHLPPADRAALAAYARGVNAYLRENAGRLSPEFALLQFDPRPWTIVDSILAGLEMHRSLTSTWKHEVGKAAMRAGGDAAKVELLFPPRTGLEIQPGSNAWAISGKHTATGKPLLANDPHLQWTLPSTWYMVHLDAPGLHVAGVSLPGAPGVIIGHNERIAWGVTNLGYDVQDLYEERIDLASGRYAHAGKIEQAFAEREFIRVKGERQPQVLSNWVTRHGPLMYTDGQRQFALRWTATEPGYEVPFLDLNRASNWDEFRAAVARFPGPGQNFVYADRDGNIGYQASGKLPIRKYAGDLPSEGWSGEREWQGYIPFDDLPRSFNPPQGYVVTANQNPFPANFPFPVHGDFAPHYRSNQIADLLRARESWKADEFLAVQRDVYSGFSRFLASQVVAAFDKRKPSNRELAPAAAVLRNWNGQMDKDAAAPMMASLVYQKLRPKILDRASPGKSASYLDQMSQAALERLLRERPAGWFADWDKVLIEALDDAVEDGRKTQGSDFARWRYGIYNDLTVSNPVLSSVPVAGDWFARWINVGPAPMSGSSSTVKQTAKTLGPSMRFVADLADWEGSRLNITTGQSGHVLSRHYKDQWDGYWAGVGAPFSFSKSEGGEVLTVQPTR